MKKFLALALAVMLILSFSACGEKPVDTPNPTDAPDVVEPTDAPDVVEPTDAPDDAEPTDAPDDAEPTDAPDDAEPTDAPDDAEPTDAPDETTPVIDVPDYSELFPEITPPPAPVVNNELFVDEYNFYYEIINAMTNDVGTVINNHNAAVAAKYSEGDFMLYSDPEYYSIMFAPFMGWDGYVGAYLGADDIDGALEAVGGMYKSVSIEKTGDYSFKTSYVMETTTFDASFNAVTQDVSGTNELEYNPDNKAFKAKGSSQGVDTFTEIVPLGNDKYLFYDTYDKAIVTYKDGKLIDMVYSNNMKYSADYMTVSGNSQSSATFYPNGTATTDWVNDKSNAAYLLSYSNGTVSYTYQPTTFDMTTFTTTVGDWTTVTIQ